MRTIRSLLSPLTVAALVVASHPVTAQQLAVASDYVRPAATTAITTPDVIRTVALYRFGTTRGVGMPSEVSVADSSGTLVANFRLKGSSAARPMNVEVLDADLFLQAETPSGVLTIVIYEMGDPVLSSPLLGRWMLGDKQGELVRRSAR